MKKFVSVSILAFSASIACASKIELNGQVDVKIPVTDQSGVHKTLHFKLPKFKLSSDVRSKIKTKLQQYPAGIRHEIIPKFAEELPPKIDLGMEGTPVLDQGAHGSCVTFATTAAVNATLGTGDYVSQLCSLELGASLAINDEIPYSGWNGSFGDMVLQQLMDYGVVSKNHQKYHGCAGVNEYPIDNEEDEGHPMDKSDYTKVSVPIHNVVQWDNLMSDFDIKSRDFPRVDPAWLAKQALAKGQRVSIGTFLDVNYGLAGAVGTYKARNDTWMLTPEIVMDAVNGEIYAGHELVVTGYDDNAVVMDENGYVNQGLFKVRNSWSKYVGDKGDFYITYDHFNIFVLEMSAIYLKK